MNYLSVLYIIIAVFVFGLLIAVHEAGHFIAAKLCGVRVEEFSIGMGPHIYQKQIGETLYSLRFIPAGGYCSMSGEDSASDDPRAFGNASFLKKLIILCAGSFNNFLLGFLIVFLIYSSAEYFRAPIIESFFDNCPYTGENALQIGDRFYSIDGHRIYMYYDVSDYLAEGSGVYDIVLVRNGNKVKLDSFKFVPVEYDGYDKKMYGFVFGYEKASLPVKLVYSWNNTMEFSRWVINGIRDLVFGKTEVSELTGVVGIVDVMAETGASAASIKDGLTDVLFLGAFIAVNLALMNMLPIPALDGGRVFFLFATFLLEKFLKHKIDPKYEGYIHLAGMILLLVLMGLILMNDIIRIAVR